MMTVDESLLCSFQVGIHLTNHTSDNNPQTTNNKWFALIFETDPEAIREESKIPIQLYKQQHEPDKLSEMKIEIADKFSNINYL